MGEAESENLGAGPFHIENFYSPEKLVAEILNYGIELTTIKKEKIQSVHLMPKYQCKLLQSLETWSMVTSKMVAKSQITIYRLAFELYQHGVNGTDCSHSDWRNCLRSNAIVAKLPNDFFPFFDTL